MYNILKSTFYIFLVIFLLSWGCNNDNNVQPEQPQNPQNPNAPVLLSPANGVFITGLTPQLDWENFSNAVSYRVQASLDANFNGTILLDSTVTASNITFPPGKMVAGVNIYWRVIANLTGNGLSNWSAIWKFISRLDPPPPPVLVSPANGSINIPFIPFFDWANAPTAEFYRIQVSNSPSFGSLLIDTNNIILSEYQSLPGRLITGTQYFWRVNASNTNGLSTSNWSNVFNFTTVQGPLPMSVSGRVTFVDTNFVEIPAYYIVGLYSFWPPLFSLPDRYVQVLIQHVGNNYFADYHIYNLPNISYRVTLTVVDEVEIKTLGIFGCDTAHTQYSSCPDNPDSITIQNYNGLDNINFLSWADTTLKIF